MRTLELTTENKSYIVQKYTDHVIYHMDDGEIYDAFKDYFYREKMAYPIPTLAEEIKRHCPEILEDNIAEQVVGKGSEYAKTI